MKIFILVCIAFGVVACRINPKKCFENYILGQHNTGDADKCDKILRDYAADFRNDIISRLKAEDDQTCILRIFDAHNITALYLKGLAQHLRLNKLNQSAYEDDVDESKHALLNAAKVLCTADNKYSEDFNEYFRSSHIRTRNKTSESSHTELCAKKYFIESKIIDVNEYNIDVPSINASSCAEAVAELNEAFQVNEEDPALNTFFGLSAVDAQKCTNEKFAEEKIFQKLYSFQIIIKFDLTPEQVDQLRLKYIKWMTSSIRFLLECVKEIQ